MTANRSRKKKIRRKKPKKCGQFLCKYRFLFVCPCT